MAQSAGPSIVPRRALAGPPPMEPPTAAGSAGGGAHVLLESSERAVAIVRPERDPATGALSFLLTSCNSNFLLLEDVTRAAPQDFDAIFFKQPTFLHHETLNAVRTSTLHFRHMLDSIAQGSLQHVRMQRLHVSRIGRLKRTHTEIYAVPSLEQGREVVISVEVLPEEQPQLLGLRNPPPIFAPLPLPLSLSSPRPTPETRSPGHSAEESPGSGRRRASLTAAERSSPESEREAEAPSRCCLECGATETPRWRCVLSMMCAPLVTDAVHRPGPQGKRTLCNSCGLRWKRQTPAPDKGAAPAPTPKE